MSFLYRVLFTDSLALKIFKNLVRQLLQGKALSIEDAADVLTLKNNSDSVGDYSTALHLLARAQVRSLT